MGARAQRLKQERSQQPAEQIEAASWAASKPYPSSYLCFLAMPGSHLAIPGRCYQHLSDLPRKEALPCTWQLPLYQRVPV